MNGVSLDTLLALQKTNAVGSVLSDSSSGSSFAALLAEQLAGSESGGAAAIASLTGAASETDVKKEMIMNLCMMMCQDGGASPMTLRLFSTLSGDPGVEALTSAQGISAYALLGLINTSGSPQSAVGINIVQAALTRLGDPYSTTYRGTGNYVDCSSLVQWAYEQAGVSLPGTSVKQAQYCYDNGYTISREELQPGDLIFWSNTGSTDGRWRQIHHVGIYAGNGKVVEAKSSTGGVVIDDIWGENGGQWKITMYARPYAAAL
jgi:Cell wall-associated hydrolases (invasion-associated proteins)